MVGCLFDYNVKPGPDLPRLKLSLARLTKARFGQVGDQVSQVKDQVSQVNARARSLTIRTNIYETALKILHYPTLVS